MSASAPTLNKMATSPQRTGPGQPPPARPPGQPTQPTADQERVASAERERVAVAMDFGAALENLVAYARLQHVEPGTEPRESGPAFPPDLLIRRDPEDLLRSTCQKLLKLEPTLLGLDRPGGTLPPPAAPKPARPPTSNGNPASVSPSNSEEPSASDRGSNSTESPTSARPPSDRPEEKASPAEARTQGGPPTSNGHQAQEGSQTDQARPDLEQMRPGPDRPNEVMLPDVSRSPKGQPPQEEKPRADQPEGKGPQDRSRNQGEHQISNGHDPQKGPRSLPGPLAQPAPSRQLKIKDKVEALLRASARAGSGSRDLEPHISELDNAIWEWNEDVVEHIVDAPAVLSAFRVGKALSLTRWRIWVVKHWRQVDGDPFVDPWEKAFCKERVSEIQRHVNSLGIVLDPQAVTAVSTSLDYWRNALLSLTPTEGTSSARPRSWWRKALLNLASVGESSSARARSSHSSSSQTIKISSEHGDKLLTALEEQLASWLDLLTGRRPPESFPVAGIVATLTKKMAADLWSRLFRLLIPVVAGVAILVIVGGLGVAGYMALEAARTDADSGDPKGGLLGSLGTAVGGVITFLAVQGRSLLGRGAANGASWGRNGTGGMRNGGVFPRSNYGVAAAAGVVADLQRDVLSGVVDQLKVEELNLAVSEPLMRCVLAFNDLENKKDDPLKDAERFLRLIYRDKSNLDRLRPVFKDLYKHEGTA